MSITCLSCDDTNLYAKKMCNRCYMRDLRIRNNEKHKHKDITISRLKSHIKELERIIECQKSDLKKYQTYKKEALDQIWA